MRFWKGLLGSWLGVSTGLLIGGYVAGTLGAMLNDLAVVPLFVTLLAGFGSLVMDDAANETWSLRRFAGSGVITIGTLMMGIFVVSYLVLPTGSPWFSIGEFVKALAFSTFVGALGGSGFYAMTRKTREKNN